jgi:hypothetical protein
MLTLVEGEDLEPVVHGLNIDPETLQGELSLAVVGHNLLKV